MENKNRVAINLGKEPLAWNVVEAIEKAEESIGEAFGLVLDGELWVFESRWDMMDKKRHKDSSRIGAHGEISTRNMNFYPINFES